jgi:hypothetical protein
MERQARAALVAFVLLSALIPAPCAGQIDRFYFKAAGGYSLPFLPGIKSELETQGGDGVTGGYGACISLGRTVMNRRWALEAHFAISIYPKFEYDNEYETFNGEVSQYDYAAVFKRCLLPDGGRVIPYVGVGAGYGVTNLISGGGKIETFHAHALVQLEAPIRDNIGILIESTYGTALTKDTFERGFILDAPGDVVLDSEGVPIEDRFSSFNIRIGVITWLRPPPEEEYE